MRAATQAEIVLRDLAIQILDERGFDVGRARCFNDDDWGLEITHFPARQGAQGLTINYRPGKRAISVLCIHWKSREIVTLCRVSGPWEELLKQLAAGRKVEA
jgi:hypothetical protein